MIANEPLTVEGRFNYAVEAVLKDEGGYSNQLLDHGGPTNFGITQEELSRVALDLSLPLNIENLSLDDAKKYYKIEWWEKYHFEAINSLDIGVKLFDMAVNMGYDQAVKITQRSLNWCGHDLDIDGQLGPKTLAAINEVSLHNRQEDLMSDIIEEQRYFYEYLVLKNPELKVFLKGWLKRATFIPT